MSATAAGKPGGVVGPSSRLVLLLSKFRATHPVQTLDNGGDVWQYIVGGASETPLILMPGAGGTAEVMFEIVSALEPRLRLVSIGYPPSVSSAEKLIAGVREILDANQIERALFAGHSLGGIVAQAFAIHYPDRVSGMALANTGFYRGVRAMVLPFIIRAMVHAPESILIRVSRAQMDRITRNAEARDFWVEYFAEKMGDPNQAFFQRNQASCMIDLLRFFRERPIRADLGWVRTMPVLAITSEDDRGFTPSERKHLQGLYGNLTAHAFPRGVGHASFIVRPQEFSEAISGFVDRIAAGGGDYR